MYTKLKKLQLFVKKYERILSGGSLITGFIVDNFTLSQIDRLFENLVLGGYLFIVGVAIILRIYLRNKEKRTVFAEKLYLILPFIVQFGFGGIFSGFTIFYWRSGSLSANWLFLSILVLLLISTEVFKKQYEKTVFQITVFFTAVFFFSIYIFPLITGELGPYMFLLGGAVSALFILLYVALLQVVARSEIKRIKFLLVIQLTLTYIFINMLYFTGSIPPIPLSLKDITIAYDLERTSSGYVLTTEEDTSFFKKDTLYPKQNTRLYAYTAVFAPTVITTDIVHKWEMQRNEEWIEIAKPAFSLSGGRDQGYRGYTYITQGEAGKWRVSVQTKNGQTLGRKVFVIKYINEGTKVEKTY